MNLKKIIFLLLLAFIIDLRANEELEEDISSVESSSSFNEEENEENLGENDQDLSNEEEEEQEDQEETLEDAEDLKKGEALIKENVQLLEAQNLEMPTALPPEPLPEKTELFKESGLSFEPHPFQEAPTEKSTNQMQPPLLEKSQIEQKKEIKGPCCSSSSPSESFEFGMVSFGIEGGVSFAHHNYDSMLVNNSSGAYSSNQSLLGFRMSWEQMLDDYWTAGITAGLRYYFGTAEGNHNTIVAFQQNYQAQNSLRYEVSGKFGKWIGAFHPYAKIGGILGNFKIQASDSTFSSNTKQWVGGATVGLGVETEITKGIVAGGTMEYDRYLTIENNLVNSTGVGGTHKVTPSFLSAVFTISCKLDKFF